MDSKNDNYAPWVKKYGLAFPYGECQCGCGQPTKISDKDDNAMGYKRNHPRPFILGHRPPIYPEDMIAPWVEIYGLRAPYGKCQCGCGSDVPNATYTTKKLGIIKGKPLRFILGHINVGRHHYKYATLREAFDQQVACASVDMCWLADSFGKNGYGVIYFRDKPLAAHRVAYELFIGPIPDGLFVCHACDRPRCANPNHLFAGTNQDNVNDMVAKGRQRRGNGMQGIDHPNYKHGKYVGQQRIRRYGRK